MPEAITSHRASPVLRIYLSTCCSAVASAIRTTIDSWPDPAPWRQRQCHHAGSPQRFFFDVAADNLSDGVARLRDMLQAPLLSPHDIQREVAVIDAENRLIQQHDSARREAAARHAMEEPAFFAVFRWVARSLSGRTRDRCKPRCATFIVAIMWPDTCNCGCKGRKRWMRWPSLPIRLRQVLRQEACLKPLPVAS